jgi:hypothetical protein
MLGLHTKAAAKQRTNELNVSCFVERSNFDEITQYFSTIVALRR